MVFSTPSAAATTSKPCSSEAKKEHPRIFPLRCSFFYFSFASVYYFTSSSREVDALTVMVLS